MGKQIPIRQAERQRVGRSVGEPRDRDVPWIDSIEENVDRSARSMNTTSGPSCVKPLAMRSHVLPRESGNEDRNALLCRAIREHL